MSSLNDERKKCEHVGSSEIWKKTDKDTAEALVSGWLVQ